MSATLKKCPFCGGDVSIRRNLSTGHTAIQCDYCRAWWTPAEHLTRGEITEAWNRRARMKIICPKCGEVNVFRATEYLRRQLFINNKGDGVGSTDDECIRSGKPRCVKCGRMVKLVKEEGEG